PMLPRRSSASAPTCRRCGRRPNACHSSLHSRQRFCLIVLPITLYPHPALDNFLENGSTPRTPIARGSPRDKCRLAPAVTVPGAREGASALRLASVRTNRSAERWLRPTSRHLGHTED